jgi:hypothetical protein
VAITSQGELSLDSSLAGTTLLSPLLKTRLFKYQLAGHVEPGQDSFSDPAMGGLVNLRG